MPRRWRVAPHGSVTPGRVNCRTSNTLLSLYDRSGLPCVPVGTRPSADSSPEISADYSALSPFPWHATSLGTGEASRGKRSYRRCRDAGFIKHSPLWMEDFAVACPLVPTVPHLVSGACPSPRTFVPRCLQTPPRETPLRFPCPSAPRTPGQETFTPEHDRMHGTHAPVSCGPQDTEATHEKTEPDAWGRPLHWVDMLAHACTMLRNSPL